MRPSTNAAGRTIGKAILQKICHELQPSIFAAPMSSSLRVDDRCCRIQKMPNALARPGTMIACRVSTQFSCEMIRYCGMTLSCAGTVIVSRTMTNSVFRPGNDSFAKANPAIAQSTAEIAAIDSDTITLLIRDWMNGNGLEHLRRDVPEVATRDTAAAGSRSPPRRRPMRSRTCSTAGTR